MNAVNPLHATAVIMLIGVSWSISQSAAAAGLNTGQAVVLDNDQLGLVFDRQTGTLSAIKNKLADETYDVQGDEFEVEAVEFPAVSPMRNSSVWPWKEKR